MEQSSAENCTHHKPFIFSVQIMSTQILSSWCSLVSFWSFLVEEFIWYKPVLLRRNHVPLFPFDFACNLTHSRIHSSPAVSFRILPISTKYKLLLFNYLHSGLQKVRSLTFWAVLQFTFGKTLPTEFCLPCFVFPCNSSSSATYFRFYLH